LVDAVQGDVEPVAAFVFNDRDFDGALFDENRLDPAVDPDPVFQMHHVVARA
jgi:hypothetical protein